MVRTRTAALTLVVGLAVAACGGADATVAADAEPGVRVVSPETAADLLAEPDRVLVDVRTPGEFDEVRIEGAVLIDFNAPDFADRVAELDPAADYVIYCRSGNRSAGAREVMTDLGFTDVADVDGGIVAWVDAGLPTTG